MDINFYGYPLYLMGSRKHTVSSNLASHSDHDYFGVYSTDLEDKLMQMNARRLNMDDYIDEMTVAVYSDPYKNPTSPNTDIYGNAFVDNNVDPFPKGTIHIQLIKPEYLKAKMVVEDMWQILCAGRDLYYCNKNGFFKYDKHVRKQIYKTIVSAVVKTHILLSKENQIS